MKISVVTVCYNAVQTLEKTMLSVLNQTYPDVEYIIIDGGSTDGTVDIIKKYADRLAYWVSEPDKGIYDAMNKGIKVATGDFLYFLGADDLLISNDIFLKVCRHFRSTNTIYYGDVCFVPSQMRYGFKISKKNLCLKNIPHQAIFYPKLVFQNYCYDLSFIALADYYLNLQCFFDKRYSFEYLHEIIANYQEGGFSAVSVDHNFMNIFPSLIKDKLGRGYYWYFRVRYRLSNLKKYLNE